MALNKWKKIENEAGYPTYVQEGTGKQQYDHPQFQQIIEILEEYNEIKYSVYRIAFKIFALQKQLKVPPLRISSGVFARHQLSLSESSLSLDTAELEAVLADIYFAAQKEGLFTGNVDLAVDLLINLLLNVYDKDRKEPVRVLAAKTLLIILSEESISDKWAALANCCADHNGCVSPKRLTALLSHIMAIPAYLGTEFDQTQADIDACFDKSAGMLGVSASRVALWGAAAAARWLPAARRVRDSRNAADVSVACAACLQPLIQVLKFKCEKCNEIYFCENCYLYDKNMASVHGHKKSHLVYEIIDGETPPTQCLSFMKTMRRFFFCTKKAKIKKSSNKGSKKSSEKENQPVRRRKDGKPVIFTSTVGKASGHTASNPANVLQDIIAQLETQNKALKELSTQLEKVPTESDAELKSKVDLHFNQMSTQINRLKLVKENLSLAPEAPVESQKPEKIDRPQAFDLFSPILVEDNKQSKTDNLKSQPRVLSLDSGNFSVISKQAESQNLMTVSGDALKPIVNHATTDSISTVSMNDISNWYNESEPDKPGDPRLSLSLAATEQRYAQDLQTVAAGCEGARRWHCDIDAALDRLQQMLANNFAVDDSCFDNTQLRETANEMEGLLGTLIRGVEQRATLNATKGLV